MSASLHVSATPSLDRILDRPDWQSRAACLGAPLSIFFPARGESDRAAKAICATCTVRSECLAEVLALGTHEPGVRAGLSGRERRPLISRDHAEVVAEYEARWYPQPGAPVVIPKRRHATVHPIHPWNERAEFASLLRLIMTHEDTPR